MGKSCCRVCFDISARVQEIEKSVEKNIVPYIMQKTQRGVFCQGLRNFHIIY